MTLEGLSSALCAKLEPASSKNKEILEINVLQKFTSDALFQVFEICPFIRLKSRLSRYFKSTCIGCILHCKIMLVCQNDPLKVKLRVFIAIFSGYIRIGEKERLKEAQK